MEVDEALEFTKPLGCTQVLVTVVSCLAQIQIAILALSTVFIAEVIPHHCIVSELDYPVQPNNSSPASIVYDRYLDSSEETFRVSDAACYVYENDTQLCTEWEFDTDFIGKTIVTEVQYRGYTIASLTQTNPKLSKLNDRLGQTLAY